LKKAESINVDLVEIVPQASPPVCRLIDYGKYLFEQGKKKSVSKSKQRKIQVKEVKLRPGTDIGDYNVKLRSLMKFLQNGDKVKVTIRFRGREMAHQSLGMEMLQRLESDLEPYGSVENRPKMEGRQMVMVLGAKKK
jgi:translation initiation factor IF-3